MSGFPRDLAVLEPWEVSVVRSLERRRYAPGEFACGSGESGGGLANVFSAGG